jgi:hypothetical protein
MKSKQKLTKEKELSSKKKQTKNQKKFFKPSSREEKRLARGKAKGISGFILPANQSEPEYREATEADWRMFEEAEKGLHEAALKSQITPSKE